MDDQPTVTRRHFVAGSSLAVGIAAVGVGLSACGSDDSSSSATTTTSQQPSDPQAPGTLAPAADVPVGGGIIVDGVVLTQATGGTILGFDATCTHAGCKLGDVTDGKIDCPCHGSKFNLDGSVAHGPAGRPLPSVAVTVTDGNVVRA